MTKRSTVRRSKLKQSRLEKSNQGAAQSGAIAAVAQMSAMSMKVGRQTLKGATEDKPDISLLQFYCPHPRARAILAAALLKRKFFADSIRAMRKTATPEQLAEMRKRSVEGRKRRRGWPQV